MTSRVTWLIVGWRPNIMYPYSLSVYGTEHLMSQPAVWEAAVVTGGGDMPPSIAYTVLIVTTTSCYKISECVDGYSGHKLTSRDTNGRGINAAFWNSIMLTVRSTLSSSYRSNRLGLSHWDPYAVHRGGCLKLYYCNMVEWFWWDSSLIFDDQLVFFSAVTLLLWSSGP